MATRRRITWFRVWLAGMILIVLAPIGWIIWELNTFAERRFAEYAVKFLADVERSDPSLQLQRKSYSYPERDGESVFASDSFITDLRRSIDEARNVKCCDSTGGLSRIYLITTTDGEEDSWLVWLCHRGRLTIGKESVDFLGPMPDVPPLDFSTNGDESVARASSP